MTLFAATCLSYAGFYFWRKNFSVLMPCWLDEGFAADQLASAMTVHRRRWRTQDRSTAAQRNQGNVFTPEKSKIFRQ